MDNNLYDFSGYLKKTALKKRARIAIAILEAKPEYIKYLKQANQIAEVIIVGAKINGFTNYPTETPEKAGLKLLELYDNKEVDAICKGQLHPRYVHLPIFERMGDRMAYFTGARNQVVAVFEHKKNKRYFMLGGGEIYSGFDFKIKLKEIMAYANYAKMIGIEPFVALMTMRRPKPANAKRIPGLKRIPIIEDNFKVTEKILAHLKKNKIKAEIFSIEYETAINNGANIIIPPIGPVGNAVARIFNFFSEDWVMLSGPVIHLLPMAIEDTFMTGTGINWYNGIISAAATANSIKEQKYDK